MVEVSVFIYFKMIFTKQNNIGNFDIKENYRKFCNEKEKIMECVPFKTFALRNLIYKYNMQENYPNLLKIIE